MAELSLVPDWLAQRASLTPRRVAIRAEGITWSFAELNQRVDAASHALMQYAGQRVGILSPNSAEFAIAVHALMRVGAVIVPLNTRLASAELDWQIADAEVAHVLREPDLRGLTQAPPADHVARAFGMDEWHSIIYTSGTTGRPKGAILTYANHYASAVASALNLGIHADDQWLACLPLFHVGGLSILLKSVIYGMTALIHPRFEPSGVNHAIDRRGVTHISVVSAMLERMLTERGDRPFPSTLRCVLLGGGPAPLPLLERALAANAPVVQTYGLTETASQVATLAPDDAVRKVGSAGKPLMGSQIQIGDDGEICVCGPTVSPGYLHHAPRGDAWLHTGDLGYLDDEGYLYVLDRRDDLIISGGENVYPAEVEAALLAHPAIEEAGVFGVPDAQYGAAVAAAVTLRNGASLSPDDLLAFTRERLAGYKVPRRIEIRREALPRNAAGKLLRRALRDSDQR